MAIPEMKYMLQVMSFVQRARLGPITSTDATVVQLPTGTTLANAKYTTNDPKFAGTWTVLLIARGIHAGDRCYAFDEVQGTSHPGFNVGGHMTRNQDGSIWKEEYRGQMVPTCYLMPLCLWHNNTARNDQLWPLTSATVLQLWNVVVQPPVLFFLRLEDPAPYAVLYFTDGVWANKNLPDQDALALQGGALGALDGATPCEYAVVFKRDPQTQSLTYVNEFSNVK